MRPSQKQLSEFRFFFEKMHTEIGKFYQEAPPMGDLGLIKKMLIAFFAGGHVLLEGIPGLGKTELVKTLVQVLGWSNQTTQGQQAGYRRIQFTPDLMPLDIVGSYIFSKEKEGNPFAFQEGPIFTHILLADEINRASPKTQSALLQGMAELEVSYGNETRGLGVIKTSKGQSVLSQEKSDRLFFVVGTQNPIEQQGTYPLPEAQLDRFFFKLNTPLPKLQVMVNILNNTTGGEPPVINPVEEKSPHEIAAQVIQFRKLIRMIWVEEEALEYLSMLALQTWPEDLPLAQDIHEGLDVLNEINQETFQAKRLELQQNINENVQMGIGPRGVQTLLMAIKVLAALENREVVTAAFVVDQVKKVLKDAWRHRLLLNFHAENNRITTDDILDSLLDNLWEPG